MTIRLPFSYLTIFIWCFLDWIIQSTAEYCLQSGHSCRSPYRCCDSTCCLPDGYNEHEDRQYQLRWNIWNMWYFWFFVIFILMLCFGGCGYWRRRQILISQQQAILQTRSFGPGHLGSNRRHGNPPLSLPVYPGIGSYPLEPEPVVQPQACFPSPPPYAEVLKEEEGRHKTDKDLLPPYPGRTQVSCSESLSNGDARINIDSSRDSSLPPYSQLGSEAPPPYCTPPLSTRMPDAINNNLPSSTEISTTNVTEQQPSTGVNLSSTLV